MKIRVEPDCFVGDPLAFGAFRLLLSKAAGYGVAQLEVDGYTHIVPNFDDTGIVFENLLGIWNVDPEDILLVLLAHSDEEGAIYPPHLEELAERIEEMIPELENFSTYEEGDPRQLAEVHTAKRFVAGLRKALSEDLAVTFHCEDVD